jgi:hypothetical protein
MRAKAPHYFRSESLNVTGYQPFIQPLEALIYSVGPTIEGSLAAKERKDRKEQTLHFYAFPAFFRG